MGPNMYLTPPGAFTSFHQDGHGTVDSGHTCIAGYNEVVMLRRLPEDHKCNAIRYMSKKVERGRKPLYEAPHDRVQVRMRAISSPNTLLSWLQVVITHRMVVFICPKSDAKLWPKNAKIKEWERMK